MTDQASMSITEEEMRHVITHVRVPGTTSVLAKDVISKEFLGDITQAVLALLRSRIQPSGDYLLPCSVHLPPSTYIEKGCPLSELLRAIREHEGCSDELTRFKIPLLPDAENLKHSIDARLNDYLCDMKPDYDDSIVGFNEAWDIVRKAFTDYAAPPATGEGTEGDSK